MPFRNLQIIFIYPIWFTAYIYLLTPCKWPNNLTWYSAICFFIEWQRNILCHDWLSCLPCAACSFVDVLVEGCSQECGSYPTATATATTPVGPTLPSCRCIAAYYAKGKCGSRQRCKPLLPHILHFSALNNVSYAYPFYCIFSMSRDVHHRCLLLSPVQLRQEPNPVSALVLCLYLSVSFCLVFFLLISTLVLLLVQQTEIVLTIVFESGSSLLFGTASSYCL